MMKYLLLFLLIQGAVAANLRPKEEASVTENKQPLSTKEALKKRKLLQLKLHRRRLNGNANANGKGNGNADANANADANGKGKTKEDDGDDDGDDDDTAPTDDGSDDGDDDQYMGCFCACDLWYLPDEPGTGVIMYATDQALEEENGGL